jgi:hypothetical protein
LCVFDIDVVSAFVLEGQRKECMLAYKLIIFLFNIKFSCCLFEEFLLYIMLLLSLTDKRKVESICQKCSFFPPPDYCDYSDFSCIDKIQH